MKLRPFELGLVIIFGGLGILALVLMSNYSPAPDSGDGTFISGPVSIWGTMPADPVNQVIAELANKNETYKNVSYWHIDEQEFDIQLLKALADGVGPDLILTSHEKLVEMRNRIQPISFESFPVRDIRDLYLDGAQIFALNDGLYGYPIAVDPLMLYWNRDTFVEAGLLLPPVTWEELVNSSFSKLIKRDFSRTITHSVVAMGEYQNVRNAFGVLSTLLIQGGSQGVTFDSNGRYQVKLNLSQSNNGDSPFRSAADFYTRFSRPNNTLYSWNRSFQSDRQEFVSENLAMYFGYGSEGYQLERLNPNLNFDIAEIPQGAEASIRRTYGKFYALSILKSSANKSGAVAVLSNFGGATIAGQIAIGSNMVPAHRSVASLGSNDTYGRIAYRSAPVALGWLNPEREATDEIFGTMTRNINENRSSLDQAISDATDKLEIEY